MSQSILQALGLPQPFGVTLLGLGLIFALAPYIGGSDFGLFKIPTFSEEVRRRLRRIGPVTLVAAIAMHVPFLATEGRPSKETTDSPQQAAAAGGSNESHWSRLLAAAADLFSTKYRLELSDITYSGMAGLHVSYVPLLQRRPDCPEDGQAGCIVGYQPFVVGAKTIGRMPLQITVLSEAGGTVYVATADPRDLLVPRLQPGRYDLWVSGEALDTSYHFNGITVLARQAALVPIHVRQK
jgi:hypothetical protein